MIIEKHTYDPWKISDSKGLDQ